MRFTFSVPGKPVPQGSMRSVGRGVVIHSNKAELLPWRASVAAHAMSQCPDQWDSTGPMGVDATFRMPRPQGHYRHDVLKPDAPWWPIKRIGDVDKLARALLDGLTDAGIWLDDSQVVVLHAAKRYDDGPGGMTCTVQRLTEKEGNHVEP